MTDYRRAVKDLLIVHDTRNPDLIRDKFATAKNMALLGDVSSAMKLWKSIVGRAPSSKRVRLATERRVREFFAVARSEDQTLIANVNPSVSETGAVEWELLAMKQGEKGNLLQSIRSFGNAEQCGGPWIGAYADYSIGVLEYAIGNRRAAIRSLLRATTRYTSAGDVSPDTTANRAAVDMLVKLNEKRK